MSDVACFVESKPHKLSRRLWTPELWEMAKAPSNYQMIRTALGSMEDDLIQFGTWIDVADGDRFSAVPPATGA